MKKSLGALILSFLLFGSVTANPTSGMELRSVLDNDLSKTLAGEVVRTKRATEDEVRKVANEVKVQYRTNENGTYDVRFVAGISSLDLSKATFNVTINNGDKSATKNYDVTHAYTSVVSGENVLSAVEVHRYVCLECGFTEEWIDKEDLEKVKKGKKAKPIY